MNMDEVAKEIAAAGADTNEARVVLPKDWRELRASIPALRHQVYLNTGVSGPPPLFAIEEEVWWARHIAETGPGRPDVFTGAMEEAERVRGVLAAFIGADADEVALTRSCSDGISLVAVGLDWKAGDEVLVAPELEHVAGLVPWYDLQRRAGVVVRRIPVKGAHLSVDDVAAAMTNRTRLICMSHVSYNTGARLPVADVAQLARERDAFLLVDGAQGPGHIATDVHALGCHFYSCAGQKWMLGPDGTGALYVAHDALDAVAPRLFGYSTIVHDGSPLEQFRVHDNARRFEVAGTHVPSLSALGRSVEALQTLGMKQVESRIQQLVQRLRTAIARIAGVQVITPDDAELSSGLVVFRIDGVDAEEAVAALWERHRIVIRWVPSPRALRASVHVFNTEEEVDLLGEAVAELARA